MANAFRFPKLRPFRKKSVVAQAQNSHRAKAPSGAHNHQTSNVSEANMVWVAKPAKASLRIPNRITSWALRKPETAEKIVTIAK